MSNTSFSLAYTSGLANLRPVSVPVNASSNSSIVIPTVVTIPANATDTAIVILYPSIQFNLTATAAALQNIYRVGNPTSYRLGEVCGVGSQDSVIDRASLSFLKQIWHLPPLFIAMDRAPLAQAITFNTTQLPAFVKNYQTRLRPGVSGTAQVYLHYGVPLA